jgi:hypothetical protein
MHVLKTYQSFSISSTTFSFYQYFLSPNNIIMMIGLASQFKGILAAKKEG